MAILPIPWAIRKDGKWKIFQYSVREMKSRHNGTFSDRSRFEQKIRKNGKWEYQGVIRIR